MKIVFILLLIQKTLSLRILAVFPSVTKSHYICTRTIIFELLNRGHEVVLISPFEEKQVNLTWIEVEVASYFDAVPTLKEDIVTTKNLFAYQNYVWNTMNKYTKYIINQPILMKFIQKDRSHFDLIFAHDFFQPIFYGFSYKYKAPIVLFSTFGISSHINEFMGNPQKVFEFPHEFSEILEFQNIYEKLRNFLYTMYSVYGRKFYVLDVQNEWSDIFNTKIPNLKILERNVSMVFLNSHFSMNGVRPLLPNMVEIGGAHIEEPKPLDSHLQYFLDEATDGAILISFGSFFDLSTQPEEFISNILQVLGSLQQRVVLKWNSHRNLTYKNIYPLPWLPQNDILAHKNVILFITHGGLLSNQEAIHHGVPILCIPFYQATQAKICANSQNLGYGLQTKDINPNILEKSIKILLSVKTFRDNALRISVSFKNRRIRPMDEAVFWMEYCAKYNFRYQNDRSYSNCPFAEVFLSILVVYFVRFVVKTFWK